ncbi:uncharacterized protein ATNIH1004_002925 [Aspergillus tanneri]|uniref:Uncharacterized protein n=1 Tax=Aspergillus tanneri TaxID=1220188 RepID=A0A5M9MZD0_9EURO|nr:uncharacterized protein ATNIH1004_002925 [Aspergillus tanneri]KAA8650243.1 hypothetical protein ATNIH1004_002925 [Aspergillus tanneri]
MPSLYRALNDIEEKLDIISVIKTFDVQQIDTAVTTEPARYMERRSDNFKTSIRPSTDLSERLDLNSAVKPLDVRRLDPPSPRNQGPVLIEPLHFWHFE